MNKKTFFVVITIIFFVSNILLLNKSIVYASDNKESLSGIEKDTIINSIENINTEKLIKKYKDIISELNYQKSLETDKDILESINLEIKSYSTLLNDMENRRINDDRLNESKQILIDELNGISRFGDNRAVVSDDTVKDMVLLVIEVGEANEYKASARLLRHSLTATTGATYNFWNNDFIVNNRIKYSYYYNELVSEISSEYSKSGKKVFNKNKPFAFKSGTSFVEQDLYYSIHGCNGGVDINIDNGYGTIVFNDIYDFPDLSWWPNSATKLLNNLGRIATDRGICKVYKLRLHAVQGFYSSIPSVPSTPSTSNSYPGYLIKRGSTGANVTKIQQRLNSLGYSVGIVDGIFGSGTESAVIKFQRSKGLSADGIVGESTWNALFNSASSTSNTYPGYLIKKGSTGANVTKIQQRLNTLGYSVGTVDGIFGNATESAVIKFQRSRGLLADGIVGESTWNALFR